jgi:general secretion pathway protein I
MLVALAVFSLAALALIRLQALSLHTTADLDERQVAGIVAHNLMVEAQTTPGPLANGDSEGVVENAGRQWRWTQKVTTVAEGSLSSVDLRVEQASGGGSPAILSFIVAPNDEQ